MTVAARRRRRLQQEREWLLDSEKRNSREKHKPRGNWTDPDSRDIMDKALDYAPAAGAAFGAWRGIKGKLPKNLVRGDSPEILRALNGIGGGGLGFMGGLAAKGLLSKDYGHGKGPKRYGKGLKGHQENSSRKYEK